jgi:sodium/potassium-transporting ATPase subunit alpha
LGIATEIVMSWAILYFPPLQKFLGTGAVDWRIYALTWLGMPLILGLDWVRKRVCSADIRSRYIAA